MEIMTPNHRRWIEFYNKLAEGVDNEGCSGDTDRNNARKVLKMMGFDNQSIEGSFKYFEGSGGFCDCEILLNVEARKLES